MCLHLHYRRGQPSRLHQARLPHGHQNWGLLLARGMPGSGPSGWIVHLHQRSSHWRGCDGHAPRGGGLGRCGRPSTSEETAAAWIRRSALDYGSSALGWWHGHGGRLARPGAVGRPGGRCTPSPLSHHNGLWRTLLRAPCLRARARRGRRPRLSEEVVLAHQAARCPKRLRPVRRHRRSPGRARRPRRAAAASSFLRLRLGRRRHPAAGAPGGLCILDDHLRLCGKSDGLLRPRTGAASHAPRRSG